MEILGFSELELSMPLMHFRNLYYTLTCGITLTLFLSILAYFKVQQIMF